MRWLNMPLFRTIRTREVPNPVWTALDAQYSQAWARVDRLQSEYGLEALNNLEQKHRTMRGFKIAYGKLGEKIWSAWQRVSQLEKRRAAVPRRVPVRDATDKPIVKLAPERKHLTNLIKMVAYQAESDLLRLVAPHYRRADDEGRTFIQAALASAADLKVTKRELRVTLASTKFAAPHARNRGTLRGTQSNENGFPGLELAPDLRDPGPVMRKKRTFSIPLCQEFWTQKPSRQDCDTL